MDTTYWVHDLSPFIFQIGDGLGLRWYGTAYILGILWGAWLIHRWARQGRGGIYPSEVQDLITWVGMGMILGGRLGYCLFYDPGLFVDFRSSIPFWGVLAVHEGGMASHGGAIGMFLVGGWWVFKKRRSFFVNADAVACVLPIGVLFGRLANFINGELWGRTTTVAWAVIFPEAGRYQQPVRLPPPDLERYSPAWYTWMQTEILPRHPSQLYAAFLEGAVVLICALIVHRRHRRPGLTCGTVMAIYAVVRFINEFWREPDAGYALFFGWMSKGQALSIPFLMAGLAIGLWAWARGPKPQLYLDPAEDPGRSS